MRFSIKSLSIVGCLGVILTAGAAVYTTTLYVALSHDAKAIEVLAPSEDVMAPKIEAMLTEHEAKGLILGELNARHEQNASLHAALTKMAAEAKGRAMNETILWLGAGLIFFVLLVRSENSRRRENKQVRNPGTGID